MSVSRIMAEVEALTRAKLEASAIVVESRAKERAPVDTGRLRSSITHEVEGETARVGTNVEYAPYVEMGTRHQAAQPYLVPAVAAAKSEIAGIWSL